MSLAMYSAVTAKTPQAQLPNPEQKPAWRAACLAYREQRRAGAGDLATRWAATSSGPKYNGRHARGDVAPEVIGLLLGEK